jgi:isopentenyl phosphate kinase
MAEYVFLKLGGSLITDKTADSVARPRVIRRLAREVRIALSKRPGLKLILGHGSGSFGHVVAGRYGTRKGVHGPEAWQGFAQVADAAAQLNRIVTTAFVKEGVPVLSLAPSGLARCDKGVLARFDATPLTNALKAGLVPLVYGDVVFDSAWGGTIASTEDVFVQLAQEFQPTRILLVGDVPGVFGQVSPARVVPVITPATFEAIRPALSGSRGTDVTGGMAAKVIQMLELVKHNPRLTVHIVSGKTPGLVQRVLMSPDVSTGTRLLAR